MNKPNTSRVVFVLGLPRSGSTLLSRLLNSTPDILSVNDLYFLQEILAMKVVEGKLNDDQVSILSERLLDVVKTRNNAKEDFIGQFKVSSENIENISRDVKMKQKDEEYTWYELMDDLLTGVAKANKKKRWADKTPQNFYHFQLLNKSFLNARFIFLFRDPRSILASYKHASHDGHNKQRYHPWVYSLYWRSAIRFYESVKNNPNVLMVRYEDMLSDTPKFCAQLSSFLDTEIDIPELSSIGHNSSFADGKRKNITSTEEWICQKTCCREMEKLDYPLKECKFQIVGVASLVWVTLRFMLFQTKRALTSSDARNRISMYVSGLKK